MRSAHALPLSLFPLLGILFCVSPGDEGGGKASEETGFERLREGAVVSDRASTGGVSWVDLDAEEVRELVVRWPSGTVDRLAALPVDRVLTLSEGQTGY